MATYEQQKSRYEAAGQGHVFQYWDRLSESERQRLLDSAASIDVERANRIFKLSQEGAEAEANHRASIEPPLHDRLDSAIGEAHVSDVAAWRRRGLEAIAANQVGVLLMAGGQGTRLGSSDPKGMYDIGLPSKKSLFQLQAERIRRLQSVAETELSRPSGSVIIPWYVMTSGPTRAPTEAFFKKNAFFGLDDKNVVFFEQGVLPAFTFDGKFHLTTHSEISTAPDGNGGLYPALRRPASKQGPQFTILEDLAARKIEFVHAYAVDNCLVKVADPVFVGYSLSKNADCAAKVVRKTDPSESVGVIGLRDGAFGVVEYSEITSEQAKQQDPNSPGQLAFRAGNIVQHLYTRDFLDKVEAFESRMTFHIAKKKIPSVDPSSGEIVKPSTPNGIKLEQFVFDVFPFAERMFILEVERQEEFSPLKNAPGTGSDDPDTSRRDLLAQSTRYLEAAGARVEQGTTIELSPLVTYSGEGLEAAKGRTFSGEQYVDKL